MGSRKKKNKTRFNPPPHRPLSAAPGRSPITELDAKPWPALDEPEADVALFKDGVLEKLPEQLRQECQQVQAALKLVADGGFAQASSLLNDIPRSSLYADWRLFVRGLIAFYGNDFAEARNAWARLNPARRPARIAHCLLVAQDQNQPACLPDAKCEPASIDVARKILSRQVIIGHAKKLLEGESVREGITVSIRQTGLVRSLIEQFQKIDPEFVYRLGQEFTLLSTFQEDNHAFVSLRQAVPGPKFDPQWRLLNFLYSIANGMEDRKQSEALQSFVDSQNPALDPTVRRALESLCLVKLAMATSIMQSLGEPAWLRQPVSIDQVAHLLRRAIELYPRNRQAHDELLDLGATIRLRFPDSEMEQQYEKVELDALRKLIEAFPEDVQATLRLADYYIAHAQFSQAAQIVKNLESQRLDNPLTRALPWRLEILQLMQASRLKKNLAGLDTFLDQALEKWPTWLPRTWLPYLQAAVSLRLGNPEKFKAILEQAQRAEPISPHARQLMTFAALQHFNLPAKDLKRYRIPVEDISRKPEALTDQELYDIAACCFDLSRAGLRHGGYRLHAGRFCKELARRLTKKKAIYDSQLDIAVCWLLNEGTVTIAGFIDWAKRYARHSHRAAAQLVTLFSTHRDFRWQSSGESLIDVIDNGSKTEQDPFYRYSLQLAKQKFAEHKDKTKSNFGLGEMFARFMGGFGAFMEDDDEDDDYYDDEEDEDDDEGLYDFYQEAEFDDDDPLERLGNNRFDSPEPSPTPPPRTAAEKKAFDKQRQKQLQQAKKRK